MICPYIKEGKQIRGYRFIWKINSDISCDIKNIIYIITCEKEKCQQKEKIKQKYIGEREGSLKDTLEDCHLMFYLL